MTANLVHMTGNEAIAFFQQRRSENNRKLESGETEPAIVTGGNAYTETSWNKLMERMDDNLEMVKEEQKARFAKRDEYREKDVPYYYLAEDGVITYNGVTFVCDERSHAICLGDMTNPDEVITIPLSEGGSLKVNRKNIDELSKAITMFSPEDIKRIMQAIALDAKVQQMENEIEDDKNSLGKSGDVTVAEMSGMVEGCEETGILSDGKIDDMPSKEQVALLFMDREKEEKK